MTKQNTLQEKDDALSDDDRIKIHNLQLWLAEKLTVLKKRERTILENYQQSQQPASSQDDQ